MQPDLFIQTVRSNLQISRWTTVPPDNEVMNHLLLLFWTWDIIANRINDRAMFEADLTNLILPLASGTSCASARPF